MSSDQVDIKNIGLQHNTNLEQIPVDRESGIMDGYSLISQN